MSKTRPRQLRLPAQLGKLFGSESGVARIMAETKLESGSGRTGAARRRSGDTPIYLAMAVVTFAIGVGMFLQLGLAGWLSVVAAASLFTTMFTLHQLGLRSGEIAVLRDELRRLELEVRRAGTVGRSTASAAAHQVPPSIPQASRPARVERVEAAPRAASAAHITAAHIDEALIGAAVAQAAHAVHQGQPSAPTRAEAEPARAARPATPPHSPAPAVAAPAAAVVVPAPAVAVPAPAVAAPAQAAAVPAPAVAGPAPGASEASPRTAPAEAPTVAAPAAPARPRAEPPALRQRVPQEQPPRASAVRDSDVEVIQGLIKKLADEVNAQDVAPSEPRADAALTATAIESSLEALRTTAGTMRERDDAASSRNTQRPPQAQAAAPAPAPAPQVLAATQPTPAAAAPAPRAQPTPADPGEAWLDDVADGDGDRLAALREAITAGRTEVYLEPILTLVDQRPRHYEVQVRPKAAGGETFGDNAELHTELDGTGLLPLLDRVRIARVAVVARRLAERGRDSSIFSGFSGESLVDDAFLNDFANAYHDRDSFASQLVLTFPLADVRSMTPRERAALEDMRDLGFRFALDHVTDLDVDFEDLRRNGFLFIKLDADVFLQGLPTSGGLIPADDICRYLAELGMTLVVGHIEDEAKFARIFGFGVLFGQGQLFGGPRLVKTEPAAPRRTAAA